MNLPLPYVVRASHRETYDTVTLVLEPERTALPNWAPGQFTMLYAFGVGEIPVSVSGDPLRQDRLVHTVRDVGAVSHAVASARPGDVLGVRGPFGRGWLAAGGRGRGRRRARARSAAPGGLRPDRASAPLWQGHAGGRRAHAG